MLARFRNRPTVPDEVRQAFARLLAAAERGAARQFLIARGARVLQIDVAAAPNLETIIGQMARAPASAERRLFAILVVDALGVDGVLDARSSRARLERAICALLEGALPDVLHRAGYPFDGDMDARRRVLATLQASIEAFLALPEPTFPGWLSGLERHRGA
jgi:hypothetical protein